MAQRYYGYTQEQANAEVIAAAIMEIGRATGRSIELMLRVKESERELPQKAVDKAKAFMSLPPEKRQALLADPSFRKQFMSVLEPDLESMFKKKRVAAQKRIGALGEDTLSKLGAETGAERAAREKTEFEARKAEAEMKKETELTGKAAAERKLKEQEQRIGAGEEKPTSGALIAMGFRDPIAITLLSQLPEEDLKNLALFDKKQGPLYKQAQQQDYFKWGVDQGFSPGLAMRYAVDIANGNLENLPLKDPMTGQPVRGKVEREIAVNEMNAKTARMTMQNNLESSIATLAVQLAKDAAIPLEWARADVVAMRQGKALPFPVADEHLMAMATLDKTAKEQAIEKNRVELMKDKAGIGEITQSLRALIEANKRGWSSAGGSAQMEKDVSTLLENLTTRTMELYGIPREHREGWGEMIKRVTGDAWEGIVKPSAAMAEDMAKDMSKYLGGPTVQGRQVVGGTLGGVMVGPLPGKPPKKLTPEQEGVMKNLYKSLTAVLADEATPPGNKKFIMDFIKNKLEPIRKGEVDFMDLLQGQQTPPGFESPTPPTPESPNLLGAFLRSERTPTLTPDTFVGPMPD